jgi:hypothetical protein
MIVVCVCVVVVPVAVILPMYSPSLLVALAPIPLLAVPSDVLGKAPAPLHCNWIAEPKLLLQFICILRAHAADVGCLLLAFAAEAPSLSMMPSLAATEVMCLHAHTLLVPDELIHKPFKEFEADWFSS